MRQKRLFFLVLIMLFCIFVGLNADAQNNNLSTRIVKPMVPEFRNPGMIDSLVAVGYFDNYTVSATAGMMSTTFVCNTVNPANWVGTDMRIVSDGYVFYSTNYGVNWSYSTVAVGGTMPVLGSDTHNNIFLSYTNSGIKIQKSTNGGVSWGSPITIVSNSNAGSQWTWCDKTSGTYTNNVYMAYVNFTTYEVELWRSTNNGVSWSIRSGAVGWGTPEPVPNGICDKEGNVYCLFYGGGLNIKKSTDGGGTFGGTVTIGSFNWPGVYNSTSGRYAIKTNIRVNACPQIACDMTNSPYANNLYCVWCENPAGPDNADIFFSKSTDHGATWSSKVRINDDNTITDQWHPAISVDSLSRIWFYWYDSRNDTTNNLMTEEWGTCSIDGGVTFMPNFKISNQNFNPNTIKIYQSTNDYYLSYYQGIASGGNNTISFYTGQNNSLKDYMAYLPDYGMYFNKAIDTVNRNTDTPLSVKIPMTGPYLGTVNYSAVAAPTPALGTINLYFQNPAKVLTGTQDSIKLNIATSRDVTPGVYTVSVTGTEAGGPRSHTRTFTLVVTSTIGISNISQNIPDRFELMQNYPNPFNPVTVIRFQLSVVGKVSLKIYDMLGREVEILVNEKLNAGTYGVDWDASNFPSGAYFYRLRTEGYTETKRMILLK